MLRAGSAALVVGGILALSACGGTEIGTQNNCTTSADCAGGDQDNDQGTTSGTSAGSPSFSGSASSSSSESSPSPAGESPLPGYGIKADRDAISLPKPDTYEPGKLDIDKIRTSRGGKDDAELVYESTWGNLQADSDAVIGKSSQSRPSVEECIQHAERGAIGELEASDLRPGDALCIVSADENVAWMRFVGRGSGSLPPLQFELTVWQRA
ncbi:hypothetical protein ACFU9F_32615 [Streptomyces zhihengii]|uniref:hypothetical protein n=1 Tax=Streptomyces zhihengii TaxID=1818004 RepID=UPI0036C0AE7D